jgi:hypothetical protein
MSKKGISCYCATYGRPKELIENSIQCFLDQDYTGPKELVILNDCQYQKYFLDHPEVRIVNLSEKIQLLGVKFNETIKLCKYDLLATWEDDDIFLKHRLSYCVNRLKNDKVFHTYNCLIEKKPQIIQPYYAYCHSTHLIDKNLFYEISGYDELDIGHIDIKLMNKITKKVGYYTQQIVNIQDRFYIYRWNTSGSYHASAVSGQNSQKSLSVRVEQDVKTKIDKGLIQSGNIYLKPKLSYDFYNYLPES